MLTPTAEPHHLPAPEEVLNDPEYYNTGKRIIKQLIRVAVHLEVDQYEADIYRHHKTRRKIHAPFPEGLVNELEYDASVSAFICLLHSHGNMSYDKIIEILSDLTDGRLRPSKGMIANLEKKFSDRSARDRQEIFNRMLVHPYMHIDGTTVRVNGKNGQVLIETSPAGTLLYYTGVKGDEAVKGTPIEEYDGTAVHDGESAFFHYGGSHQGCLVHELRYLKGSMDNEPGILAMGQNNGLLKIGYSPAACFCGQHDVVCCHLFFNLTGNAVDEPAFLCGTAAQQKDADKNQCKHCGQCEQPESSGLGSGLFEHCFHKHSLSFCRNLITTPVKKGSDSGVAPPLRVVVFIIP
jgi:hypothetical protein